MFWRYRWVHRHVFVWMFDYSSIICAWNSWRLKLCTVFEYQRLQDDGGSRRTGRLWTTTNSAGRSATTTRKESCRRSQVSKNKNTLYSHQVQYWQKVKFTVYKIIQLISLTRNPAITLQYSAHSWILSIWMCNRGHQISNEATALHYFWRCQQLKKPYNLKIFKIK